MKPLWIVWYAHSMTNILGLAEMAGCQVYTEGCLACIVSVYPIFSLSLLALPPGNSILHHVTNFAYMRMEFKISSRFARNLVLLVLHFVLKPVFHYSAFHISILPEDHIYGWDLMIIKQQQNLEIYIFLKLN